MLRDDRQMSDLGYLLDAVKTFTSDLDKYYAAHPTERNPFRIEVFDGILDKLNTVKLNTAEETKQVTFSGIEVRYLQRVISAAMVLWEGQDEVRCRVLNAIADELERQSA